MKQLHLGLCSLNFYNGANGNRISQQYLVLGISKTCSEECSDMFMSFHPKNNFIDSKQLIESFKVGYALISCPERPLELDV